MLRVTPIYGSRWSNVGEAEDPSCTLVEYGGCRVLWNVGWCAEKDPVTFPVLPEHDCLILTDSSLEAAGGLPLYYQQMNSKNNDKDNNSKNNNNNIPPIYATFPTVKMGQMTLYDQHAAVSLDGGVPSYSLQDLDQVFGMITSIKYSQCVTVHHPLTAQAVVTVTAHRAGHCVGGAFYVLQRISDETVVVLTSTYHIAKELHLDSSTLLQHGSTPDVLVTRAGGPAFRQFKALAHKQKQKQNSHGHNSHNNIVKPALPPQLITQAERGLSESIMAVLRRDGNVLLPTDASGRVLELLLLLNQHWERHRLQATYNLVWLGPMVTNTAEFARCQLEWMGTALGSQFDSVQTHPYNLKAVRCCSSLRELEAVMEASNQNPTCVLATGLSLERGPARDVFLKFADNPDNAVILTDSSQAYRRSHSTGGFGGFGFDSGDGYPHNSVKVVEMSGPSTTTTTTATTGTVKMETDEPVVATTTTAAAAAPGVAQEAAAAVATATATTADLDDGGAAEEGQEGMQGLAVTEGQLSEWTTAGQLLSAWAMAKAAGREMDDSVVVDVQVPVRAPLVGTELKAFIADEEAARLKHKKQAEKRAMLREVELAKGQLRLGEEDNTTAGGGQQFVSESSSNKTSANSGGVTGGAGGSTRPRKKSRFDSSLFLKFSKPLHLTFEIREEAVGLGQSDSTAKYGIGESVGRSGEVLEDDYGIAVLPERFTDIVSGVDPSKFAGGSGRLGEDVARRGFGFGVDKRSKSKQSASGGAARVSEDDDGSDSDDMDEEALEAVDLSEGKGIVRGRRGRPPTKVSTIPRRIEVLAEVSYVPLEGRVDARAARQSVRALQPRQVIVLGGTCTADQDKADNLVDEVKLLAEAAVSFATGNKHVHTPSDGVTAELDVGHAAYAVRLINDPYQTFEEKEKGVIPPEPVEPFEAKVGACTVSIMDCVATGQKVALDGSIVLAPRSSLSEKSPSVYVSDGEVLLTDLRAELIAQGMKAEYSAHSGYSQLVVNGKIVVKKDQDGGRMHVEGPLCEDFYTVRSFVCGQYVNL